MSPLSPPNDNLNTGHFMNKSLTVYQCQQIPKLQTENVEVLIFLSCRIVTQNILILENISLQWRILKPNIYFGIWHEVISIVMMYLEVKVKANVIYHSCLLYRSSENLLWWLGAIFSNPIFVPKQHTKVVSLSHYSVSWYSQRGTPKYLLNCNSH